MNVLLLGPVVADYAKLLREMLKTPCTITGVTDLRDPGLRNHLLETEIVVTTEWRPDMPPAPRLKLVQVGGAGTDAIDRSAIPPGVTLCNAFGHEAAIAEYVLLSLLAWHHDFLHLNRSFRAGSWAASPWKKGLLHGELAGKTVGILGLGRTAGEVAKRLDGIGVHLIGCNRSPRADARYQQIYPLDRLRDFLSRCDALVVTCALTPETTGLLNASNLGALPAHAVLVNVARGPVIEEEALFRSLSERRIAGAILDVWYRYPSETEPDPRPSRFPFHELDNAIMTPHASAWTRGMLERRVAQVAENIDRVALGRPLVNVVASIPLPP